MSSLRSRPISGGSSGGNGMYLMIQNVGVAPVEGYTVLGVSTTRDCGKANAIGQFGSGGKHSVNLLLRNGLPPVVFCGGLRLEFYVVPEKVDDGLTVKSYGQVRCKMSGTDAAGKSVRRDKDLSFALEYGGCDWTDLSMALREFVSNALDRTIREEGDFKGPIKESRLKVEVVDDQQVRAKWGFTRVFIPLNAEVQRLHFSEPEMLGQTVLPKRDRNLSVGRGAMIYKKGVFVREVSSGGLPSLFDYNFGDELQLDESRNVDDFRVRVAATLSLRDSAPDVIAGVFKSLLAGEKAWESTFDSHYLSADNRLHQEQREAQRSNWRAAWDIAAGEAVLCEAESRHAETVRRKGHRPVEIASESWATAAAANGVRSAREILDRNEQLGREIIPATESAEAAVFTVWSWLSEVGLTLGKAMPPVSCFRDIMRAECEVFGFYDSESGGVFLNECHASEGLNKRLLQSALEEVVHHLSAAGDCSRDFQSFPLKVIVEKFAGGAGR
jgi:hypothetical protein